MRRRLKAFLPIAALASVLAFGIATPAHASATQDAPSPAEEAEVRDLLTKFAVPSAQQDELLATAAAGLPWDVYEPGAVPTSTETTEISGFQYTISRYDDGSIAASGIEIPVESSGFQTRGIVNCTYSSGSGYSSATGCQIDGIWGTVILGATGVNYTLVQGGPDQITRTGVGFQRCAYPTSCSTPNLVYSSPTEGTSLAQIMWQGDVSAPWGSWNAWVKLFVGNDTAYTTTS